MNILARIYCYFFGHDWHPNGCDDDNCSWCAFCYKAEHTHSKDCFDEQ